MRKLAILVLLLVVAAPKMKADEGMWLIPYLQKANLIKDMKSKGFKLSAKDIDNINGDGLKDAIVIFGGGCTGEIVSSEGLLLTNHHCGYGAIQQHSTVTNDYLKDGFWAMSRAEEIPTPGLAVIFIRKIVDVSDKIMPALKDITDEHKRNDKVTELGKEIIKEAVGDSKTLTANIRSMFGGNQYFMFVMERYNDVRMVGAPPSAVGKFGGDTDNWMWPRHTGDFSVFRVYADKDGRPATYSKDNVPYKAPAHLKVSTKGVKPGDFTMIIGFPGGTDRYMTSFEIDRLLKVENPIRIFIRGERQDILKKDMMASDKIRIQYASKYAGSSNYWKNSIGKSRGLVKLNVKGSKQQMETQFTSWVNADGGRKAKYGNALNLIKESVDGSLEAMKVTQYLGEAMLQGVEIIGISRSIANLLLRDSVKVKETPEKYIDMIAGSYKNYSPSTDRKVAYRMFQIVKDSLKEGEQPSILSKIHRDFAGNTTKYVDNLYDNSIFSSQEKVEAFIKNPDFNKLKNDPALELTSSVLEVYYKFSQILHESSDKYETGHRLFIAGLMEMQPDKTFYPDANFTMRFTYGQVLPYSPADGVMYDYYTTAKGIMDKEDPNNAYEFTVPEKLKTLYANKDFGPYAEKGVLIVNFLSNNDITGGNSGSPIMNGKGELIGLAFDGNWEAMSGDIAFEPKLQRTINVDIRYVLFIMDKYAGAKHLVDEMTLVSK